MTQRHPLGIRASRAAFVVTLFANLCVSPLLAQNSAAAENMRLGQEAFAAEKYDDAAEHFSQAFALDPTHAPALYNRAFALRKAHRLDDARATYNEYMKVAPNDLDGIFGLAETERQLLNNDAAVTLFRRYLAQETRADRAKYRTYAQKKVVELSGEGPAVVDNGETTDAALERGNGLYRENRFDEAADAYDKAFQADRTRPDALLRRALALRKGGRYAESVAAYDQHASLVPDDLDGLFGFAEALRLNNDLARAREMFEIYLSRETRGNRMTYIAYAKKQLVTLKGGPVRNPEEAQRLFEAGLAQYKARAFLEARELFLRALTFDDDLHAALYRAALAARKAGELATARGHYRSYVMRVTDDADAYYGWAETERLLSETETARLLFHHYAEIEKRPSESQYVESSRAFLAESGGPLSDAERTALIALLAEFQRQPTIEAPSEAPASKTTEPPAATDAPAEGASPHSSLPMSGAELGRTVASAELIEKAEERYQAGDLSTSAAQLTRALHLRDGNPFAWYLLGKIHRDSKRETQSRECFAKALALDPSFKTTIGAMVSKHPSEKELVTAERRAAADARERLARASLSEGRVDEALTQFESARRDNPYSVDALLAIGDIHAHKKDTAKAVDAYQAAAAADVKRAEPLWRMARIHDDQGREVEAKQWYQRYLRSGADDVIPAQRRQAWLRLEGVPHGLVR